MFLAVSGEEKPRPSRAKRVVYPAGPLPAIGRVRATPWRNRVFLDVEALAAATGGIDSGVVDLERLLQALAVCAPEGVYLPFAGEVAGLTEPEAVLVLVAGKENRSILFCRDKNLEREIWDGIRLGPEAAPQTLGVDEAYSVTELETQLPKWLENKSAVWFPFAIHDGLAARVEGWLSQVRARVRLGAICPARQMDACTLLDEMRLIKDGHELATMRQAARISAAAHVRAMKTSAQMLRAGMDAREYHLEAELLHEFRRHGSQFPAYTSIVAAGANACVLHYRADVAPLRDGELVLIDAGCELDGYASDITRTFPANGRFSPAQKTLYELVLAAQVAAAESTRPGARWTGKALPAGWPHRAIPRPV